MIEMSSVSRVYPGTPPVHALRTFDLAIAAGEYIAVVGPSGSGKSTLLNLLGLLDRPSTGSYHFEGVLTSELNEAERAALRGRRIGFVFQDFHLLGYRTATENVALAGTYLGVGRRERTAAARRALSRVGLAHRMDALPTTMSGGERQRVAVARALFNAPALLLCDEPTGNLDSVTAAQVLRLLGDLNDDGFSLIVITHSPSTAERAQRHVTISDGRITI